MTITTTNWQYQGAVAKQYNGCTLKMAEDNSDQLDWNAYPVQVTKAQYSAISYVDNVFNILAGKMLSPIVLSEVQTGTSLMIDKINDVFTNMAKDYKKEFKKACELDKARVTQMNAYPQDYLGWLGAYLLRTINGHYQTVQRDGSANRYAWMIATGAKEKLRMEALQDDVERRSEELVHSIQEELDLGFHNQDMIQELDALERLYKKSFPKKALIVKRTNVREFLTPLLKALNELSR